jgi:hypothetical protein
MLSNAGSYKANKIPFPQQCLSGGKVLAYGVIDQSCELLFSHNG